MVINSGEIFTKIIAFNIISIESRVGNPEYDTLTKNHISSLKMNQTNNITGKAHTLRPFSAIFEGK